MSTNPLPPGTASHRAWERTEPPEPSPADVRLIAGLRQEVARLRVHVEDLAHEVEQGEDRYRETVAALRARQVPADLPEIDPTGVRLDGEEVRVETSGCTFQSHDHALHIAAAALAAVKKFDEQEVPQ